jgi:hypothetical protein
MEDLSLRRSRADLSDRCGEIETYQERADTQLRFQKPKLLIFDSGWLMPLKSRCELLRCLLWKRHYVIQM